MSLTSVQTQFYDTFGQLYAGQLADYGSNTLNEGVRNYRAEDAVVFGRGVVKGTLNAPEDPVTTPYGAKTPLAGSVLADVVGIAILNQAASNNTDNEPTVTRFPTMIAVAEVGSGVIVGANVPDGITVAHGDPVYMSVSHATIPVGAFSNAADTGLIAITGATWYGAATAGTVGRIKL